MPVTVKNVSLWRKEVENQVGMLAHTLEPISKAGANLRVLMGYRYPGDATKAAIELYPALSPLRFRRCLLKGMISRAWGWPSRRPSQE